MSPPPYICLLIAYSQSIVYTVATCRHLPLLIVYSQFIVYTVATCRHLPLLRVYSQSIVYTVATCRHLPLLIVYSQSIFYTVATCRHLPLLIVYSQSIFYTVARYRNWRGSHPDGDLDSERRRRISGDVRRESECRDPPGGHCRLWESCRGHHSPPWPHVSVLREWHRCF